MGRSVVRTAVTSYITNASLPYIGTVYSARPTIVSEQDYEQTLQGQAVPGTSSGSNSVVVINLPSSHRQRRALVGRGPVNDTNIHKVALEILFANTGGDAVAAQTDHDTIMDNLTVIIREDPTLGGQIWSAAEYTAGIQIDQGMPYTDDDGLVVFIPTVFRFEVWEWISGTGV